MKKNIICCIVSTLISACSASNFMLLSQNVPVPGETKLNKADKAFTVSEVFPTVKFYNPSCTSYKDYKILDTKVTSYGQWKYGPSWQEEWVVEACGEKWLVPLSLSADGTGRTNVGTSYAYKLINGKWIKNKPITVK